MQRFVRFMAQFPKILTKFVQKMASYSLLQMRSKRDGLNIFQIFSISTQKLMKAFLMSSNNFQLRRNSIIRLQKVNLKKLSIIRNLGRALDRTVTSRSSCLRWSNSEKVSFCTFNNLLDHTSLASRSYQSESHYSFQKRRPK